MNDLCNFQLELMTYTAQKLCHTIRLTRLNLKRTNCSVETGIHFSHSKLA